MPVLGPVLGLAAGARIPYALSPLAERNWHAVRAKKSGYTQEVDHDSLMFLARERKTIVRMGARYRRVRCREY